MLRIVLSTFSTKYMFILITVYIVNFLWFCNLTTILLYLIDHFLRCRKRVGAGQGMWQPLDDLGAWVLEEEEAVPSSCTETAMKLFAHLLPANWGL